MIIDSCDDATRLTLRNINLIRILKNDFSTKFEEAENRNASTNEIISIVGKNRSKLGIFEGNSKDGLMEIGQIASIIDNIKSTGDIVNEIIVEFSKALTELTCFIRN